MQHCPVDCVLKLISQRLLMSKSIEVKWVAEQVTIPNLRIFHRKSWIVKALNITRLLVASNLIQVDLLQGQRAGRGEVDEPENLTLASCLVAVYWPFARTDQKQFYCGRPERFGNAQSSALEVRSSPFERIGKCQVSQTICLPEY